MACGPQMVGRVGAPRSADPATLGFATGGDCLPSGGPPPEGEDAEARDAFSDRMRRWTFALAVGALIACAVAAALD